MPEQSRSCGCKVTDLAPGVSVAAAKPTHRASFQAAYGLASEQWRFRVDHTHSKIFVLFLYFFIVSSVVATGRVNAASFQLTWVDNSENEDGFNIERKLDNDETFSLSATVGPNVTSYDDDNLANNTTYCYRVNAFNDAGNSAYTNEACGTTPITAFPPSGNTISTNIANGAILSGFSFVWTAIPSGSPVRVEFFIDGALLWTENFSPYQFNGDPSGTLNTNTLSNGSHQLKVRATYSDNSTAEQTVTVTVSNGVTPTPPSSSSSIVTATLLGQTGEDIVGTTSETPDGIQDVHIRLSGVQSTITGVVITGGDLGGRWETPFNGANWVVAVRPQANPSLVDLYFDFFRPNSFYNLNLTFADGSIQTIQTSTPLSTASLRSETVVTLTAAPAAGSTFAPRNSAVCINSAATIDASKSCAATSQAAANQLITKIGVFRPDSGEWFLDRSGNGQWDGCSVDTCITSFGQPGDLPAIRSWSGAGTISLGTFNPTAGIWQLDRNGNGRWDGCAVDTCITFFGQPGDLPATRGISGFTEIIIGTFQPQQGLWKFDLTGNNTFDSCSIDQCDDNFGALGDIPVVGDWNGSGTEEIGVFRPNTGEWFLDFNGNGQWDGCRIDKCLGQFGGKGDLPVVGDWNGTGEVRIGVFRPNTGEWFLDMNGNGKSDGCAVDACPGPFGQPGDLPVVGKW